MIPKIIWQTYKDSYEVLPQYMKEATDTWKNLNPDYEYIYMDDNQAADFVLKEFGKKWHKIFTNVPVGVMRGDLWRYLVIYKFGGVYADLDTLCLKPISNWMLEDKKFIVCPETNIHFCQWTFAAEAGSPILKSVLDEIKKRFKKPVYGQPHFVHYMTGPAVWTTGILNALDVNVENLIEDYVLINFSENAKLYGFHNYGGSEWRKFHFEDVQHIYGSQKWSEGYVQWIQDPLVKESGSYA